MPSYAIGTATIPVGPLVIQVGNDLVRQTSRPVLDSEVLINGTAVGSSGATICTTDAYGWMQLPVSLYTAVAGFFRVDIDTSDCLPCFINQVDIGTNSGGGPESLADPVSWSINFLHNGG